MNQAPPTVQIGMVEQPILVDRWYPGESRHFLAGEPEPSDPSETGPDVSRRPGRLTSGPGA